MKKSNTTSLSNIFIFFILILTYITSNADDYENYVIGENNEIIKLSQKYKHLQNNTNSNLSNEKNLTILDSINYGVTPQIFYYNDNYKLDSAVIPYQSKYVTKFDSDNNLILEENYENWGLNSEIRWAGVFKYVYEFDDEKRLIKSTEYYPLNELSTNIKVTWFPTYQSKYIYNENTKRLEKYYFKTNFSLNDTIYETGYFYEYLPNQNIIYQKSWDYQTKTYGESEFKFIREFNDKNQLTFVSQYKYDSNIGWALVNGYSRFVYDNNDNLQTITQTNIDASFNTNVNKTNFIYNINNQIESKVNSTFSKNNNDWVNETNTIYQYDEKNNITQEIKQKWNTGWEKWVDQTKKVTNIDNDLNLENLVTTPKFKQKILSIINYKNFSVDDPEWELQNESNYHYSQKLVSSIEEFKKQDLIIYPNPTTDFLNIGNYSNKKINIKVYDIIGNLVLLIENFQNELLDVSNLNKGTYFLLINDNQNFKSIKFVKN